MLFSVLAFAAAIFTVLGYYEFKVRFLLKKVANTRQEFLLLKKQNILLVNDGRHLRLVKNYPASDQVFNQEES